MSELFFDPGLLESALSLSAIFMSGIAILLSGFKIINGRKYNQKLSRTELSLIRESLERRLYEVNGRLLATPDRWEDVNHLLISAQKSAFDFPDQRHVAQSSFLSALGICGDELNVDRKSVFVLTPFHRDFDQVYRTISKVSQECGFDCSRSDDKYVAGAVLGHIVRMIVRARLVIAVIDGRNPNVFYELGIAHALGKNTLLVSKNLARVPFDLRSQMILLYNDYDDLRRALTKELVRIESSLMEK